LKNKKVFTFLKIVGGVSPAMMYHIWNMYSHFSKATKYKILIFKNLNPWNMYMHE
jgi:hypothetical protein